MRAILGRRRYESIGWAMLVATVGIPGAAWADPPARPTIAILDFEAAPAGTTLPPPSMGTTLADLLLDRLVTSGEYRVLDGRWLQQSVNGGGKLSVNAVRESAEAAGVDYLVIGSMTQFSAENRRRRYGALIIPLGGGVGRQKTELIVGILIRIVNVRSGEVLTTASSQGSSSRGALNVGGLALFAHGGGGGFSKDSSNTRDVMLSEAVRRAVAIAAQGVVNAAPRLSAALEASRSDLVRNER